MLPDFETVSNLINKRRQSALIALLAAIAAAVLGFLAELVLGWSTVAVILLVTGTLLYGFARWARGWVMGATYIMARNGIERLERQIKPRGASQ